MRPPHPDSSLLASVSLDSDGGRKRSLLPPAPGSTASRTHLPGRAISSREPEGEEGRSRRARTTHAGEGVWAPSLSLPALLRKSTHFAS